MGKNMRRAPAPDDSLIKKAFDEARDEWSEWRNEFEWSGPPCDNPLLTDSEQFRLFCREWAVSRTIRAGKREALRERLLGSEFKVAINDHTGQALDQLNEILKVDFGTRDGKRGIRSILSKVATVVQPQWFTAWDSYAPIGLNIVVGRNKYTCFDSYALYLCRFNSAWNQSHGERIREIIKSTSTESIELESPFQRHVMDLYLMKVGGYKSDETKTCAGCFSRANPKGRRQSRSPDDKGRSGGAPL